MRPFLSERCGSIFAQTFADWELFAYDSQSDDGAWEFLQSMASGEARMRLAQGPREGPYPAWNECLRQTTGEFVYIATSDDTMAPDCLEKLVDALDRNPDCDLAHCPLRVIDSEGALLLSPSWPDATVFADGLGDVVAMPHIRKAPHDGLLHLTGAQVYLSITQLLIRRSLFLKIGNFPSRWSNVSDFNWEMKAGLVASTVHVPDTWASWRIHPAQATALHRPKSLESDRVSEEMIQDAIRTCEPWMCETARNCPLFEKSKSMRDYSNYLTHEPSVVRRRLYQVGRLLSGPPEIRHKLISKFWRRRRSSAQLPEEIREWFNRSGMGPAISMDQPERLNRLAPLPRNDNDTRTRP